MSRVLSLLVFALVACILAACSSPSFSGAGGAGGLGGASSSSASSGSTGNGGAGGSSSSSTGNGGAAGADAGAQCPPTYNACAASTDCDQGQYCRPIGCCAIRVGQGQPCDAIDACAASTLTCSGGTCVLVADPDGGISLMDGGFGG